jgi:hypothetical protein
VHFGYKPVFEIRIRLRNNYVSYLSSRLRNGFVKLPRSNRKALLYALVGNDFGSNPESRLDEIRDYKRNEARFLIQSLNLKPNDCVLDLGSSFRFIARVVAPLLEHVCCLDISSLWVSE